MNVKIKYFEQLYTHTANNLREWTNFLKTQSHSKQGEINEYVF